MIKFDTKLALTNYIATGKARETIYEIKVDETLQGKKTVYKYTNGTLVLLSENITAHTWRNSVNTFAALSTVTDPLGMDAVIITADETHNNNKTWYLHDGYQWNYKGAYQKRETDYLLSAKDTRGSVVNQLAVDFDYIVGNNEVDIYLDGVLANQYLTEFGDVGFASRTIKFKIDIPISTDIEVRKSVPNIDDEPRTNDEVYVGAFKHNYIELEKYMKYEKSVVIEYPTFADAQNDLLLVKEGQVIRTFGHVTKNDGRGRYWILESTDKDFAYRNKANTFFINRLIGADEVQIGTEINLGTGQTPPPEHVHIKGQIANRADFKRIWAWAVATGRVVTEAAWNAGEKGCFSSGDLSTTFRFPEGRGYFHRAFDDAAGVDTGRILGNIQGDAIQEHRHSTGGDGSTVETGSTGYNLKNITINGITYGTSNQTGTSGMNSVTSSRAVPELANGTIRTAQETRPKNISKIYYMKI